MNWLLISAKCYLDFYGTRSREIAAIEEGWKKDYLMSALRLMMKEQCPAFWMTAMNMPDPGLFAFENGPRAKLPGTS